MATTLDALLRELGLDAPRVKIRGLSWDSRMVSAGDLFFALRGRRLDGHEFIPQAIEKGAAAVVGEREISHLPVPYIQVPDVRAAMGKIAAAFFGHPTRKLTTIGVTGTDGKTTVAHLLGQILPRCEALTTIRVEREGLSCVTTPEAPEIQRLAAEALARGKRYFVLEASSIGLVQRRLVGTEFRIGVFTNLSRDHLDFHGTMEAYLDAKLLLFESLPSDGYAVVNGRSPHADKFFSTTAARPIVYGIEDGEVWADDIEEGEWKTEFTLVTPGGKVRAMVPYPGRFNLENALAAAAAAWAVGLSPRKIAARLAGSSLPEGRLQRLRTPNGAWAVVDYAHTPQALEAVLKLLRPRAKRLFVVFGAPGEADKGKRPLMGKAAGEYADFAIVTSDNPKGEDPACIAAEIVRELEASRVVYEIELDRARAIRRAVELAGPGDIVLVAGKGHERYQHIGTRAIPHSDICCLEKLGCETLS